MSESSARFRYAVGFAIDGDVRFLAHSDMIRMFGRAFARTGLPLSYSEGFNPRVRLALPFPKPVGQASDAERLIVDLRESVAPDKVRDGIAGQMPDGVTISSSEVLQPTDSSPPRWVRYVIATPLSNADELARRAASLLDSDSVVITRVRHKDGVSKVVNIRPFLDTVEVCPEGVTVSAFVTNSGTVRPAEVCGALGMEADAINHLVRRVQIAWHKSEPKPTP